MKRVALLEMRGFSSSSFITVGEPGSSIVASRQGSCEIDTLGLPDGDDEGLRIPKSGVTRGSLDSSNKASSERRPGLSGSSLRAAMARSIELRSAASSANVNEEQRRARQSWARIPPKCHVIAIPFVLDGIGF